MPIKECQHGLILRGVMKFRILLILSLGILTSLSVSARKPAVEDFVGVIPESYQETPKGTEVLFDFSKKVHKVANNKLKKTISNSDWTGLFGLATIISLPLIMWVFITRSATHPTAPEQTQSTPVTVASTDSTRNNISNLDDYRNVDDDDNDKKAS